MCLYRRNEDRSLCLYRRNFYNNETSYFTS